MGNGRPGRGIPLLLVLPLSLARHPGGLEAAPPQDPPERSEEGGLRSLHVESQVLFRSAPDKPHVLETTLGFPERARTLLRRPGEFRVSDRRLVHRIGDRVWLTEWREGESKALKEDVARDVRRELDLRAALLLWPHAFPWERAESGSSTADLGDLGSLRASPGEAPDGAARPETLAVLDGDGGERGRFERIEWERDDARGWRPVRWVFVWLAEPHWDETVAAVDHVTYYPDRWFLPPDQRALHGSAVREKIRQVDVPPLTLRRVALEEEISLSAALDRAAALHASTTAPEGCRLTPDLGLELDHATRPRAILLVLAVAPADPPEGWSRWHGRPAVGRPVESIADVTAGKVARLARAAEVELEEAGPVLLRVERDGRRLSGQLALLLPDE